MYLYLCVCVGLWAEQKTALTLLSVGSIQIGLKIPSTCILRQTNILQRMSDMFFPFHVLSKAISNLIQKQRRHLKHPFSEQTVRIVQKVDATS